MRKLDPANPLRLAVDAIASNDDAASPIAPGTPFPVRLVAYSGGVIADWGDRVVLDLATMSNKPSIPMDWAHDWEDNIGVLDKFDNGNGAGPLTCIGAIIPTATPGDKGLEVATKMRGKVPYQASVEVHQADIQEVPVGEKVTVNGRDFDGPIYVYRNWTLDAVAVCKWGKDRNTAALAASKKHPNPGSTPEGVSMSDANPTGAAKAPAAVIKASFEVGNAVKVGDKMGAIIEAVSTPVFLVDIGGVRTLCLESDLAAYTAPAEGDPKPDAPAVQASVTPGDPRAEFARFSDAFGDRAGEYFKAGLKFEDAMAKFSAAVVEENKALNAKLKAVGADLGADKPLKANVGSGDAKPSEAKSLFRIAGKSTK